MKCCICGNKIEGYKYGNNAEPIKEGNCCDKCNDEIVIPARINNYYAGQKKSTPITKEEKEKEFDQQEALGILKNFGTGNFQDVMDYELRDWEHFFRLSVDLVPPNRRAKYHWELQRRFTYGK